jgi:hypothetical protein
MGQGEDRLSQPAAEFPITKVSIINRNATFGRGWMFPCIGEAAVRLMIGRLVIDDFFPP